MSRIDRIRAMMGLNPDINRNRGSSRDQLLRQFGMNPRQQINNLMSGFSQVDHHGGIPSHQTKRTSIQSNMDRALQMAAAAAGQAQTGSALTEALKARGLPDWAANIKGFDVTKGSMEDLEKYIVENPQVLTNKNEAALDFIRSKGYTPEWGKLADDEAARSRKDHMFERGTKSVAKLHKVDTKEYSREEAVGKLNEGFEEGAGRGIQLRGIEQGQKGFYTKNLAGGVNFVPDGSQGSQLVFGASDAGEKKIRDLSSQYGRLDFMFDPSRRNTLEFERMMRGEDPNQGGFGVGFREAARDVQRVLDTEIIPGFSLSQIPILGQAVSSFAQAAEQAGAGIAQAQGNTDLEFDPAKFARGVAGAAETFVPGVGEIVNTGLGLAEAAETGDFMAGIQHAGQAALAGLDRFGVTGEVKELIGGVVGDQLKEFGGQALNMMKEKGLDPSALLNAAKGHMDKGIESAFEQVGQQAAAAGQAGLSSLVAQGQVALKDLGTQAASLVGQIPGPVGDVIKDAASRVNPQQLLQNAAQSYGQQALSGNFDPTAQLTGIGRSLAGAVQGSAQDAAQRFGKQALSDIQTSLSQNEMFNMARSLMT